MAVGVSGGFEFYFLFGVAVFCLREETISVFVTCKLHAELVSLQV